MRRALVLILTILNSYFTFGQTAIGIKGGPNYNTITIKNAPYLPVHLYQPSIGFHAGVFTKVNIADMLSINPELVFVQRGAMTNNNSRINLNYLELPILFSIRSGKFIVLELGPNASLLLSAKEKTDTGKQDVSNQFNKSYDFGINGGLTFHINKKFSVAGRYYRGFLSVMSFTRTLPITYPTGISQTVQCSLHYTINE